MEKKPEEMGEIFWSWSQQVLQVGILRRKRKKTMEFQSWVPRE